MPRQLASSIENNFVNGFVTEATALNFPEAAATDTANCIYLSKGAVKRRLGIDFEASHSPYAFGVAPTAITTFVWTAAAGSGLINFTVVQLGRYLYFYRFGSDTGALSSGLVSAAIDLRLYKAAGGIDPDTVECQFAAGKGFLFVTHPYCDSFYVKYDPVADTFTATTIGINIRDFEGLSDDLQEPSSRLNTLSLAHKYNLYNQGWCITTGGGLGDVDIIVGQTTQRPPGYVSGDPLQTWINNRTDFPSNSDVWWLYKDSHEYMQPKLANVQLRGNSPAPKGHYILSAFYQDRSGWSGLAGIPIVSSSYLRPSAVAFHASRVFYSGVNYSGFNNKVYFSQIVETDKQMGKCYQENDPTSEFSFDLLPTDGGVIKILDCGSIVKLVSIQNSLLVFATNGVWAISGSQGIGFTANDYTIRRISSIPCLSASSFVDVLGSPMWWNSDGIYAVSGSDAMGQVQITSLTDKKIKQYFTDTIPTQNKLHAKGCFDSLTKTVQWVFRRSEETTANSKYEYDSILVFNVLTQAFYPWILPNTDVKILGVVSVQGASSNLITETVTNASGALVVDNGYNNVNSRVLATRQNPSVIKYLTQYVDASVTKTTWSEQLDPAYVDFKTFTGGQDFISYTLTGYKVHGEAQKNFQANHLFIYCDSLDANKFHFQSVWDYALSGSTGDFGTKQLIDVPSSARAYVHRRLKIRGTGKSVQYKITSMSGQPFNVVGWSVSESGTAQV